MFCMYSRERDMYKFITYLADQAVINVLADVMVYSECSNVHNHGVHGFSQNSLTKSN